MTPVQPLGQSRTLVFLAYPQMGLLDLTGAQTVFWANPLTEQVSGTRDPQGRLHVDGTLKVKG